MIASQATPPHIQYSTKMEDKMALEVNTFRGGVLGYTVFKRTYAAANGQESFRECVQRQLESPLVADLCQFNEAEKSLLQSLLLDQKCSLSGRYLQTLGSKINTKKNGFLPLSSCAVTTVASLDSFLYTARLSMLGVGVGFSVQAEHVDRLPPLYASPPTVAREDSQEADHVVQPDENREGWIGLFHAVLEGFFGVNSTDCEGSFTYSLHLVQESERDGLEQAVNNVVSVLTPRAGLQARPIDCMDVMNILAPAMCQGKTRRAALLAIGDATDTEFLKAKRWDLGYLPLWRSASNNSVACSDVSQLPQEFWEGYKGNGEALGLVNLDLTRACGRTGETQYPDPNVVGVSACAEQGLEDKEVSCLAELMLPHFQSPEELWDATRLVYTVCKNTFRMEPAEDNNSDTIDSARKNMRMGIGITGYMQASEEQKSWLSHNYQQLRAYDQVYSTESNLPSSIKLTTVKPSGTVSLLSGTTPGCHPGYAQKYIRRIRFNADDPILQDCREMGLHVEDELGFDGKSKTGRFVAEFPCELAETTQLAEHTSAVEQLEVVQRLQKEWSDSAVSVTVYYRKGELDEIRQWLAEHYTDSIKACSFLLHCDHGFLQAPYEKVESFDRCPVKADDQGDSTDSTWDESESSTDGI